MWKVSASNSAIHQAACSMVTSRSMQNGKNFHWLWMGGRSLKTVPAGGTQSHSLLNSAVKFLIWPQEGDIFGRWKSRCYTNMYYKIVYKKNSMRLILWLLRFAVLDDTEKICTIKNVCGRKTLWSISRPNVKWKQQHKNKTSFRHNLTRLVASRTHGSGSNQFSD